MFFPLQFATLNTSQHTPFVYISISPPPLPAAFQQFCRNKTRKFLYQVLYTEVEGGQSHSAAEQQWRCTVLTVGKYNTERSRWLHELSHAVPALTISQLCFTLIH